MKDFTVIQVFAFTVNQTVHTAQTLHIVIFAIQDIILKMKALIASSAMLAVKIVIILHFAINVKLGILWILMMISVILVALDVMSAETLQFVICVVMGTF
jgi:hypothetical protein